MFPLFLMSCWNPEIAFQIYDFKRHHSRHPQSRRFIFTWMLLCAHATLFVFKEHEKFELSDFEVFSSTEIKIMIAEKNIAFTCVFKEK